MSFLNEKKDKYNCDIYPGDICVYNGELVVYVGRAWGGSSSPGEFGRFISEDGNKTVKYKNVVFAFSPIGTRRNHSPIVAYLVRRFYEST